AEHASELKTRYSNRTTVCRFRYLRLHTRLHNEVIKRNISKIYSPMVCSGLSAVMVSWNTMAICAPRTCRIAASFSDSKSCPSNNMRPDSTLTPGGNRRMMALDAIDFPEPDSPTRHKIWLRYRSRLMFWIA